MADRHESTDASVARSRIGFGEWNVAGCLLMVAGVCLFRVLMRCGVLNPYWQLRAIWLWVVGGELALLCLLSLWFRPRYGVVGWIGALVPVLVVFAVAGLLAVQQFDAVAMWTLELLLCGAIAIGWGVVIAGGVLLLIAIALRLRRRPVRLAGWWLKCWVMTAAFLGTAEVAVRMIERFQDQVEPRITLPQRYREADDDELRIVALGGSTMMGFPYEPKISIPAVLAELLQSRNPDRPITVRNLAQGGINFREAAEKLTQLDVRPGLLLLYTGHNEFFYDVPPFAVARRLPRRVCDPLLEWSRSYRWLTALVPQGMGEVSLGADGSVIRETSFTNEVMVHRLKQFRIDLRALAEHCRQQAIPTLWFLPATNEGLFLPNRSTSTQALSAAQDRDLNRSYRRCRALIERRQYEQALGQLDELLSKFPEVAELEFWRGVCLREMGQIDAARRCFQQAANHDRQPSHTTAEYREIIRSVAERFDIELIDAEPVLRRISPTQLLDRHVIHDNVHPTLRGYYELGLAAAHAGTVAGLFNVDVDPSAEPLSFDEVLRRQDFTTDDLALAYKRIAWCFNTLSYLRPDPQQRLDSAGRYQHWAELLSRGEIQPGEDGTESLTGESAPGVRLPDAD